MEFITRHKLSRPFDEWREQWQRLVLDDDSVAQVAQLARAQIELEMREADNGRRGRAGHALFQTGCCRSV
jgi:hypothetical protein